jgi:hypothetical protein
MEMGLLDRLRAISSQTGKSQTSIVGAAVSREVARLERQVAANAKRSTP